MSRFSYLLFVLFLLLIGSVVFNQLSHSIETTHELIKRELVYGLKLKINRFFFQNQRFPNNHGEIKRMVNDLIGDTEPLELAGFIIGNNLVPTKMKFVVQSRTHVHNFGLRYYGCEYAADLSLKGKIDSEKLKIK